MKIAPPVWQGDYFDHFIRSAASYREKWIYVHANPVRPALCSRAEDWTFQGTSHALEYR